MTELHEQARRLADVSEKLLHETEQLRRDVGSLAKRIAPDRPLDVEDWSLQPLKVARTFVDMFKRLEQARRAIGDAERQLGALRAVVQSIAEDVVSREGMKEWLIDPRRPKDRG